MDAAQELISSVATVHLDGRGNPVPPPDGLIFSASPREAGTTEGARFVIKGPDPSMVAAEAVGYLLARASGLTVPDFAIATIEGEPGQFFASALRTDVITDVTPWLSQCLPIVVRSVVLDVWLVNDDRNIGSYLAAVDGGGSRTFVLVDFEKAKAISLAQPIVGVPAIEPRNLWPRGPLAAVLRRHPFPSAEVARIRALPDATVRAAVAAVQGRVSGFTWADSTLHVLLARKQQLDVHVREVWRCSATQ